MPCMIRVDLTLTEWGAFRTVREHIRVVEELVYLRSGNNTCKERIARRPHRYSHLLMAKPIASTAIMKVHNTNIPCRVVSGRL